MSYTPESYVGRPTTASGLYRLRLRLAWSVFPLRFRLLLGLPFALAKVILLACLALRLTVRFSPDLRARTLAVLAPVAKSYHSGHTPQISYPAYPAYSGLFRGGGTFC